MIFCHCWAYGKLLVIASKTFIVNPIRPGRGGGGGAKSARSGFNLRELPCYLSNTYEILPLLLKFIGEQGFVVMATRFLTPYLVKF